MTDIDTRKTRNPGHFDGRWDSIQLPPHCLTEGAAAKLIREIGMAVKKSGGEMRVTFTEGAVMAQHPNWTRAERLARMEAVSYYTDDPQDALDTARAMIAAIHTL